MFVFWFNTYFLEHGVTLKHPDGAGTIVSGRELFFPMKIASSLTKQKCFDLII